MGSDKDSAGFLCIKYTFFAYNVCIWLLGCSILSVGIWLLVSNGTYSQLLPSYSFLTAASLIILVGAVIVVAGFLGFCGALFENQCMLISYFTFVLLLFGLEVTALSLFFVKKDEIKSTLRKEMLASIREKYQPVSPTTDEEGLVSVINNLQQDLHCCGVYNHTDWYHASAWPERKIVPDSCCLLAEEDCGKNDSPMIWDRGCMSEIEFWFIRNMYVLGVAGVTLAALQILGLVAAIMLFCCIRQQHFLL